jgi:hypothetical protein
MKESNQLHYEGVINHITNEKTTKIRELETKINAKDAIINELKIKEGELISKEKMIASFNLEIERLH